MHVIDIILCMQSLRGACSFFAVRADFANLEDSVWQVGCCVWDEGSMHDNRTQIVQELFPNARMWLYSDPRTLEMEVWDHLFPECCSLFTDLNPGRTYTSNSLESAQIIRRRSNHDVLSPPTLEKYNKGASKRTKSFSSNVIPLSTSIN